MGAQAAEAGRQAAGLVPALVDALPAGFDSGLPAGVLDHCTGLALALGALAGVRVSAIGVAVQVRLPEVMAASYGSTNMMRPSSPWPAGGDGWLHADLGSPGDRAMFDTVLSTLPSSATSAEIAAEAQEWRLPVCDYRPRPPSPGAVPPSRTFHWEFRLGEALAHPARTPRVLDLTNMWAGPLATWLLASLGWSVTKVEPSFRPDGFRALDGRGIHPGGAPCDPGRDSGMWNALNHGKDVVDLDLRRSRDRDRFLELAGSSDVVIDSFSPRVMANFGLPWPEGPVYVSMPAFPPGPMRNWSAYGTGIHAVSGLGEVGAGRFAAPLVAYPDPVAGFTAALAAAAAIDARRHGIPVAGVDCPLLTAVQPLLGKPAGDSELSAGPEDSGARLLRMAASHGRLERREVCGRGLLHPGPVFQAK